MTPIGPQDRSDLSVTYLKLLQHGPGVNEHHLLATSCQNKCKQAQNMLLRHEFGKRDWLCLHRYMMWPNSASSWIQ